MAISDKIGKNVHIVRFSHGLRMLTIRNQYQSIPMGNIDEVTKESTFILRWIHREILEQLCVGSSMKQIAEKFGITVATANRHRSEMCRLAKVTQSELPIWGLQNDAAFEPHGVCRPGMHPRNCTCNSVYCTGKRRRSAA